MNRENIGMVPAHTTAQDPSLMWDQLKALLPAPCPTLHHNIMPPPTILHSPAGRWDRQMGSWGTNLHHHIPGEQLERISLKIQPKAITLHISDIHVNDSAPENHAKIWFLQIHNKTIISLVDNECIFYLILAMLFLRLIWKQDSCLHLLPWVLFSLLHKQAKQLQDKSKAGEGNNLKFIYQ